MFLNEIGRGGEGEEEEEEGGGGGGEEEGEEEGEESLCVSCWREHKKVVTIDCGHPACLPCLRANHYRAFGCSQCLKFSQLKTLQADIVMYPEGEDQCVIHLEDQKFFCDFSLTLLCVTCSKSEEHVHHMHWPIAMVALRSRKDIQEKINLIRLHVKVFEEFQLKEEKPLAWAVVWTNSKYKDRDIFEEKIYGIWEHLQKKMETLDMKELRMGKGNEKFSELYQKLKEREAIWEQDIMKQKREWEPKVSRKIRYLKDITRDFEEKIQKSNVELLKDLFRESRSMFVDAYLEPFIPHMNDLYLIVVNEFLEFFHTFGLWQPWNSYNLLEGEKKRTITCVPGSSGETFVIYNIGNFHKDNVRIRPFLLNNCFQSSILEEKHSPIISNLVEIEF